MSVAFWCARPGLAGGIDKDGSRAIELLSSGFGSVEFGTVTPQAEPDHNPGVAALVARLSALDRSSANRAVIGVSLGAGINSPPAVLAEEWLAGMRAAWPVADYLCFNLSARAYRPLLEEKHTALLVNAISTIMQERTVLVGQTGRRFALALKFPLDIAAEHWPDMLKTIAGMALDSLIAVLPETPGRLNVLNQFASLDRGATMLVAVGGIRTANDVRAVLQAGAEGIQVHGAFVEHGVKCLPHLLEGISRGGSRDST
jgi:dihydroorotate dehydrogenase